MLLAAASPSRAHAHPIHSTLSEVVIGRDGALVIRIRTFVDDLSLAVHRQARTPPRPDHVVPDDAVARYVLAAFTIRRGGKPLPLRFVSQQRTGDVVWVELRGRAPSWEHATLHNTLLFEVHADQVNVVKTIVNRATFTTLFSAGDHPKAMRT
jgi:hypothetical protein